MKIRKIGSIGGGQDGAVFGSLLFRLDHRGECTVYDLAAPIPEGGVLSPLAAFPLGGRERLVPHSNAVFFGDECYSPTDEFPILYTNVYNNRASSPDPLLGTLCAYRLLREETGYKAELVGMIRIGFCEDAALWRATEAAHGVRPFGNFVFDRETGSLWAFVMRDKASGTRYFRFSMPSVHAGTLSPVFGVKEVVLGADEIVESFDMPYYEFIQGATCHRGRIYSTEGFSHSEVHIPAIRVVEPWARRETYYSLPEHGMWEEPEMIDFFRDECYYSDANGNLYRVCFEGGEECQA